MAHYDPYEEEAGEMQEISPSFDESLVEALESNVQLSVNKALAKALSPLTSHLKGFARQQGWFPSIAASAEPTSQPPKPSKGKSKAKKWAHSEVFEQLSAEVLELYEYSNPRAQAHSSDDSPRYPEMAGSDSSHDPLDSDQEERPGPVRNVDRIHA
ncbi:hypothetical protein NDU88_001444 [Pleurodeles waltl]|uniref:Uncharacterized protein n=1 Tax=Pleurodeles waltl TaxID=8319 RepID=A0AAV7P463_PLEWA|nr:hypothetical protein NDU88_001444 [Pleurodeles waltl]